MMALPRGGVTEKGHRDGGPLFDITACRQC